MKLREADARAVDLILDRAASSAQGDGVMYAAAHSGVSNEHITAVERVLKLLDGMPTQDPAGDLVQRTMQRIGADTDAHMHRPSPALIDVSRPHA